MIYLTLFYVFFKIGLFTIGGGYAMIPLITDEVIKRSWLDKDTLINFMGISESTPGPFAINIATFIGIEQGGILGGFIATLGVILPSFLIILLIAKYFSTFSKNKWVQGGLYGIRPAVLGLLGAAGLEVLIHNLHIDTMTSFADMQNLDILAAVTFVLVFVINIVFKLSPIKLIGISAVLGVVIYYLPQFIF